MTYMCNAYIVRVFIALSQLLKMYYLNSSMLNWIFEFCAQPLLSSHKDALSKCTLQDSYPKHNCSTTPLPLMASQLQKHG